MNRKWAVATVCALLMIIVVYAAMPKRRKVVADGAVDIVLNGAIADDAGRPIRAARVYFADLSSRAPAPVLFMGSTDASGMIGATRRYYFERYYAAWSAPFVSWRAPKVTPLIIVTKEGSTGQAIPLGSYEVTAGPLAIPRFRATLVPETE